MNGFDGDGYFKSYMKVWDGENYATYGWSGSSGTDLMENSDLDKKWLNDDLEEVDETMDKGAAAWVIAEKAGTMTVSGQVPTNSTTTIQLSSGFNMVANPYPVKVKVANFGKLDAGQAGFDGDGYFKSYIKIWDGANYATFGWSGSSGTDLMENPDLDNKWLNDDLEETDDEISFGTGVWVIAEKAGTITFENPSK